MTNEQTKEKIEDKRCNATIVFGDDYGDNTTTFHCQLRKGHKGKHQEKGVLKYPYCLTWGKLTNPK